MDLPLTSADLIALKTATHDLIKAVGGVERAALLRGVSAATVHRWYAMPSETEGDQARSATIDAISIFVLERDLAEMGSPRRPVTECLARMNGCDLTATGTARVRKSVTAASSKVMGLTGQFAATIVEVLEDGVVTAAEAQMTDRIAGQLEAAVVELRGELAGIRAETIGSGSKVGY